MSGLLTKVFSEIKTSEKEVEKKEVVESLKIIPEPRLNALIVISDKQKLEQLRELLKELDVFQEEERTTSNFRLYPLKFAVAKDLAPLLLELTGRITEIAQTEAENKQTAEDQPTQKANEQADISITADEATNSLLIFASPETLPTLEDIIARLDVPRLQVYVEALLMEVTLTKSLDLGINWRAAGERDGRLIGGGFPNTTPLTPETLTSATNESTFGIVGGEITFGDQTYFSFGAFIRATQTDQDVNVLANPQIMMLNNVSSSINVTTNTPVSTRTVTNSNGVSTTETEFKDIGIKLTIKPQISGTDSIRLEIAQESSNIVTSTQATSETAITTFKRELNTTVVTRDNEIVVLGGLIDETRRNSENSVPGFRDLPLLGGLFAGSNNSIDKTNLLLFIRPKIIRTQEDLREITRGARQRYQQGQEPDSREKLLRDLNLE
jgi:general secretion pathway protein D